MKVRGGNPLGCAYGNLRGPPRYGLPGRLRFTVGRGPVPRHASGPRALIPSVGQDRLILPVREQVLPDYSLFKVCKTLMSIARAGRRVLKVL